MLYRNRNHDLEGDVTAHVIDTAATCNNVLVSILQAAQVVLISFVQQVVGGDVELGEFLAAEHDVSTSRQGEQGVARCLGFRVVSTVDVRLLQIAIETGGNVEVVECYSALGMGMAELMHGVRTDRAMRMVEELPLQLRRPLGRRGEGQILRIRCCVQ